MRDVASGGTCCWTVRSQSVKNSETPTPATHSSAAIAGTPRPEARIAPCEDASSIAAKQTTSVRSTRTR